MIDYSYLNASCLVLLLGFELSVVSPTSSSTSMSQEDIAQLQAALQAANIPTKAVEPNSGRSVFLAYDTIEKVMLYTDIVTIFPLL